ncbi:helix-turn-helix domain-containing protein [Streptomyces ramulosus]|uniref:Helix-turn-helix domain-containing protein n=1 Tax=Streptomyces ramulosus TaxID=47762 RepID=A0ABW1FEK3_9ACTN
MTSRARGPWDETAVELRPSNVPVAEQLERLRRWRELTSRARVPARGTGTCPVGHRASIMMMDLGQVRVTAPEFPWARFVRTRGMIQRSDPQMLELGLVVSGSVEVQQARDTASLGPGDLGLWDSSRPFEAMALGANGPVRMVIAGLPRRAVPVSERALRGLVARGLPSHTGVGAVLGGVLHGLVEQAATLPGSQVGRLGAAVVDLASAFLAGLAGTEGLSSATTRQTVLLSEVRSFIQQRLGEPQLSPTVIAEAHHISVRSLHLLFQRDHESVGAFIREQRLRRCRADLADPLLDALSAGEIGARWGFTAPAVFSRAFKARYGLPPGEYRRRRPSP